MALSKRTPLADVIPGGWHKGLANPFPHVRHHGKTSKDAFQEMCLVCSHSAEHDRINGGTTRVTRQIFYRIRGYISHSQPSKHLHINREMAPCGYMALEQYEQALRVGSPDGPNRGVAHSGCPFDFTALCYVAGFVCSRTMLGVPVELSASDKIEVLSFYAHFDLHTHHEPVITKALYNSPHEMQTLLALLRAVGIKRVFTTAKTVCERGSLLTGRSLCHYTMGMFCTVLAAANSLGCGTPHLIAWFRGCTAAMSLCCHNDEGGWLRRLLKMADLPPSIGIVPDGTVAAYDYPKDAPAPEADTPSRILELFFLCVRCISSADPCDHEWGTGSVVHRMEGEEDARAICFDGFHDLFSLWCDRFLKDVSTAAGLAAPDLNIEGTFASYWKDSPIDKHFEGDVIAPWYMVEPGPFDVFDSIKDPFQRIGAFRRPVKIPMLGHGCLGVSRLRGYSQTEKGTAFRDSRVRFACRGFTLRGMGISYVWSGDGMYNYLLYVKPVKDCDSGYIHDDLAMSRSGGTGSLSEKRWVLPHAPVPNPIECWGGTRNRLLQIIYSGQHKQGCYDDLVKGCVTMSCSTLNFSAATSAELPVCARTVPEQMRKQLDRLNRTVGISSDFGSPYLDQLPYGSYGDDETSPVWRRVLPVDVPASGPRPNADDTVLAPAIDTLEPDVRESCAKMVLCKVPPDPRGVTAHTCTATHAAINLQARNISAAGAGAYDPAPPILGRIELNTGVDVDDGRVEPPDYAADDGMPEVVANVAATAPVGRRGGNAATSSTRDDAAVVRSTPIPEYIPRGDD